jgi:hypothetical protein
MSDCFTPVLSAPSLRFHIVCSLVHSQWRLLALTASCMYFCTAALAADTSTAALLHCSLPPQLPDDHLLDLLDLKAQPEPPGGWAPPVQVGQLHAVRWEPSSHSGCL